MLPHSMLPLTLKKIFLLTSVLAVVVLASNCGTGAGNTSGSGGTPGLGVPTITSLSPSGASPGGPDFVLSVYGTNLSADHSVVCWNGQDRPTGLDCVGFECLSEPPHIDAMISAGDIVSAGTVQITVYNPGTELSNSLTFTIAPQSPPPPCSTCIDEIVPSEIAAGSRDFTLTVNGEGFFSGITVMWDNMTNPTSDFQRPTTYISYNQVTAAIPASDVTTPGSVIVFVEDEAGGVVSNKVVFTIK
jgi:hypothetical protein